LTSSKFNSEDLELVRKDMNINEHARLFNITLRHNSSKGTGIL